MGVAIVSMAIHGQFVATGSEDGFLRIWSTDFSTVTMETGTQYTNMYMYVYNSLLLHADLEGAVTSLGVASDGMSVMSATSTVSYRLGLL